MKTSTLLIGTVLLAGFAGSTFAQGYYHHHYHSDGVALASSIVGLVKTAISPTVVVTPAATYPVAEPVYTAPVYSAPVYAAPVYTAPVYYAPPRRYYYHHRPAPPPPRGRSHRGYRCR